MKILAIRGKNLASLEGEFEIDFTKEPLCSAGIFAITGSTGAGKSTILDALCLALFDDTPRANRAQESIAIPDVKDKMINQKDSRAILRRGTAEGYAEVDFISLGGEMFRSRWMVKRARGKVDGSLQNSEIRLLNLSAKVEEQGRKTELLNQIVRLLGLTFDQFTRSVLLAQGDFATFLKARQVEKAELLEKLTGTEIYSRISIAIYEKTKNAEQEYQNLFSRIKDIELLSEEHLIELGSEKQRLVDELEELKKDISLVTDKIKWIVDEETLRKNIHEAKMQLTLVQQKIVETKPRYDYLTLIEKVQEIRDVFQEWKHTTKQLNLCRLSLDKQLEESDLNADLLKKVELEAGECERRFKEFCEKAEQIEPQIIQARELDVRIIEIQRNLVSAREELIVAEKKHEKSIQSIQNNIQETASLEETMESLSGWFDKYRIYEPLISRIELLLRLLEDMLEVEQQVFENTRIQNDCKVLLEQEQAQLLGLKGKAEKLQQLLPAEIVEWRSRLQDGVPCPVCGSIHHPLAHASSMQSLQEAELDKMKQEVTEQIQVLSAKIEDHQKEVVRLDVLIGNYRKHAEQIRGRMVVYLEGIPDWQNRLEQGVLKQQLQEIASQWTKYTDKQIQLRERVGQLQAALKVEQDNEVEMTQAIQFKKQKTETLILELEKQHQVRDTLLRGKAVDLVVAACTAKRKELEEKLKWQTEKCHAVIVKQESLKATVLQTQQEVERLTDREKILEKTIQDWQGVQENRISTEELANLFTRTQDWVQQERRELKELEEQKTVLLTTITERKNNLLLHMGLERRPLSDLETLDFLKNLLTEKTELSEQKSTRITEIVLSLTTHQKNKDKVKAFVKELDEKRIISENWKKLNELFGSASGFKFKEIAQGYTLDILLGYANKHLKNLSERYELQRIPDTLALQVADLNMLGETRTVHSLSGGESFLISLALALGLASLSSNRMNVESLFIDEGFGSLDIETLRVAMDALECLQTQGRKIGIISHVTEMTERITVQIQVLKSSNGRSRIKIMG